MPKIAEDRLKASFIINTIHFALSEEDVSRTKWIQKNIERILTPNANRNRREASFKSLFVLLKACGADYNYQQHCLNIDRIWRCFVRIPTNEPFIFLRLALSLSYSGAVIIPSVTYPTFIDKEKGRFVF